MEAGEVKARRRSRGVTEGRGFTLVELLVVIAIIAVLLSMLLPALGKARKTAKRAECGNSMKQVALAIALYVDDNGGFYPPYKVDFAWPNGTKDTLRLQTFVAPYMGFPDPNYATRIPQFYCPDAPNGSYWKDFLFNSALCPKVDTRLNPMKVSLGAIGRVGKVLDAGRTLLSTENKNNTNVEHYGFIGYTSPLYPGGTEYRHLGRANVTFADGHLESLKAEKYFNPQYPLVLDVAWDTATGQLF